MNEPTFSEILEAAGKLPVAAREELIEILQKRTIEERRKQIAGEIKEARQEYKQGKSKSIGSADLMNELLS